MNSAELDHLYRKLVLEHYRDPRCQEPIPSPTHTATASNPLCGDVTELSVQFAGGCFSRVKVRSGGCSICVASGSMMGAVIEGKAVDEVRRIAGGFQALMNGQNPPDGIDLGDLRVLEGVLRFPERIRCATLPWGALRSVLEQLRED